MVYKPSLDILSHKSESWGCQEDPYPAYEYSENLQVVFCPSLMWRVSGELQVKKWANVATDA